MVPFVPIEAGHLVREETPDMESTGGVPTFTWPPASERPGSCLSPGPEIHQTPGLTYSNEDRHLCKKDKDEKGRS